MKIIFKTLMMNNVAFFVEKKRVSDAHEVYFISGRENN